MSASRNRNAFSLTVTGSEVAVLGFDEGRLRQILDNLLANAARHTHDGRIELSVRIGPPAEDGTAVLDFAVADTGEGIAAGSRTHLPAFRTRRLGGAQRQGCRYGPDHRPATGRAHGRTVDRREPSRRRRDLPLRLARPGAVGRAGRRGTSARRRAARRTLRHRPSVPVVLVSAAPPPRPTGVAAKLDFAAHLLRPLDHDAVLRRIGGWIAAGHDGEASGGGRTWGCRPPSRPSRRGIFRADRWPRRPCDASPGRGRPGGEPCGPYRTPEIHVAST